MKATRKRILCLLAALVMMLNAFSVSTLAVEKIMDEYKISSGALRASGRFSLTVSAGKLATAETSFPLEKGDTVKINASYAPADAVVNIGLIEPDKQFYYFEVSTGSINKTIEVDQHGYYTLAIENTSNVDVTVNGTVKY